MAAIPQTFAVNHIPSADEMQSILDLLNAMSGLPAPTSTALQGTATSGTTETLDVVLGTYSFIVPAVAATWRYEVLLNNVQINAGASGDVVQVRIRDGGASTPTASSMLVAQFQIPIATAGGTGQASSNLRGTWVPGAGTHTLGMFLVRVSGTGVETPVATTIPRELYVGFRSYA